jgi:hypothetical protein
MGRAGAPNAQVLTHLTLTNVRSPPQQPLDRCYVSSFKSRSFNRNGHLNRTMPEHSAPDAQVQKHLTPSQRPINR